MYLLVDTETTGLPKNWKAPVSDLDNWPRLIQLAWIQYDKSEKIVMTRSMIVKPVDFSIPKSASKIHGITTGKALSGGHSIIDVLAEFKLAIDGSKFLIAHNMSFDEKVLGAEFLRQGTKNPFGKKTKICTKEESTEFCAIPGNYGYKWPTLSELHTKLFEADIKNAHDAEADVETCAKCFFELKRLGVVVG